MNKNNIELFKLVSDLTDLHSKFDKITITSENKKEGKVRVLLTKAKGKKEVVIREIILDFVTNASQEILGYRSRMPRVTGKGIPSWSGQLSKQPDIITNSAHANSLLAALGIKDVRVVPSNDGLKVAHVVPPEK